MSSSGWARRRRVSRSRASTRYWLLAMAVSLPLSMSRAACTMRSSYSSGMPRTWHITAIGRCSANSPTRSARPSSQKRLTRRWVARLMWRRSDRWSMVLSAPVTAPRSRRCSSPSAWEQMGCQAMCGISGLAGWTSPSRRGFQMRLSRVNCEGERTMCRFSPWPRTTHTGTSSCSRAGATAPCSSRSSSYRSERFSAPGP